MNAPSLTIAEESARLTGSAAVLDGQSGSGKSFLGSRILLANLLSTGGAALVFDPTGHIEKNVRSQERHAIAMLDDARATRNDVKRDDALNRIALFRSSDRLKFCGAGQEEEFADTLRAVITTPRRAPFGVIMIDEGGFARQDKNAREHLEGAMRGAVPLARNARALVILTGHRLMAGVPEIRAVMRYRVMWANPDPTAQDAMIDYAESKGWNIYSDAMGAPTRDGKRRFYRGIQFEATAARARPFELERDTVLPRWMYLPAVMSEAPEKAMTL